MLGAAALIAVAAAAPLKLATVGFTQVGLTDAQAQFYAEHLSTKLAEDPRVRVVTPKDMAAVIGVEKQKQLLKEFATTEDGAAMPQRKSFLDKLKNVFKD